MQLRVEPDGTIRMLYDERLDLSPLGTPSIERASFVEPQDSSWVVDLAPSGGPILGAFSKRSEAIQAEIAWLDQHRL